MNRTTLAQTLRERFGSPDDEALQLVGRMTLQDLVQAADALALDDPFDLDEALVTLFYTIQTRNDLLSIPQAVDRGAAWLAFSKRRMVLAEPVAHEGAGTDANA